MQPVLIILISETVVFGQARHTPGSAPAHPATQMPQDPMTPGRCHHASIGKNLLQAALASATTAALKTAAVAKPLPKAG